MDDSLRLRALHSVCIYMGHDIVAHHLLPLLRHLIVDIVRMGLQLIDLLLGDIAVPAPSPSPPGRSSSFLQVRNFLSGEKMYCISLLA